MLYQSDPQVDQRYWIRQRIAKHHNAGSNECAWAIMVCITWHNRSQSLTKSARFSPGHWWSICTTDRNPRRALSAWPWTSSRWSFLIATYEPVATSMQHALCDEELLHLTTKENVKIIDEANYEMKSTKKKPPSKKVLFEAVSLTENFALVRKNDLAKQLRKHTA